MATRNLTRQFMQLRTDAKAKVLRRQNIVSHRNEHDKGLRTSPQQDVMRLDIAPEWVNIVNGTNEHVTRITSMST